MLKPRREPGRKMFRRKVKIDGISRGSCCDSRSKYSCSTFGRRELLTKLFIPDCPEYGRGVVYCVADKSVPEAEMVLIGRMSSPYPLTGPVYRGSISAQFSLAEDRKRNGRYNARYGAGNEAVKKCTAPGFSRTGHD